MQRKTVRRVSKVLLTWLVVFTLTLDTASACHPFRTWVSRCYVAQPVYCGPTVVECCPTPCCPTVSSCEIAVSDCCGDAPVVSGEAEGSAHESMRPATEPAPPTEVTPADQPPALSPADDLPNAPAEANDQVPPLNSIDILDPSRDGAAVESSPNDLDRLPDTMPNDALTEPMEAAEIDEPADALGDMFAEPATEEPAAETQPADDLGDMFAEPATEEPATETQPSDDLGDLFAEPSTEEPAADTQPANDLGDLFGEPATDGGGELMQDAPAEVDPLEDMFGTPEGDGTEATPAEPATDSLDDMFGDPSAETAPPATDSFEDIFGATPDRPSSPRIADGTEGLPSEQPNEQPEPQSEESTFETDLDDLFGQVKPKAGRSLAAGATLVQHAVSLVATTIAHTSPEMPMRTWTDNTGTFQTTARLAVVGDGQVRLLKENGRFTTVPMRRLSQGDLAYVQDNAQGLGGPSIVQVAGR